MKNNDKIKKSWVVGTAIVFAVVVMVSGTLALFTDSAKKEVGGKGGKVGVYLSNIQLENAENINPGDNDEKIEEKYFPTKNDPLYKEDAKGTPVPVSIKTTSHDIKFTVENRENKSIRTRQTIKLDVKDEKGNVLDPKAFEIIKDRGVELGSQDKLGIKRYVNSDGKKSVMPSKNDVAIEYEILTDIFDGVSNGAEKEDVSTVKDGSRNYTYKLKMSGTASNEYQGAVVNISVSVDALQFRNTQTSDWQNIGTQKTSGRVSSSESNSIIVD